MIDFKLQFHKDDFDVPITFFTQTDISIENKLNFLVIYAKYCLNDEEADQLFQSFGLFTEYINDTKICRKFALILYYISKNNVENMELFNNIFGIDFISNLKFDGYKTDQLFLKYYLTLCIIISKKSLNSNQDDFSFQFTDDLFENQFDLFEIAFSNNNYEVESNVYRLLKLIYKVMIKYEKDKATELIDDFVNSEYFEKLINLCEEREFRTTESIFMFLSILTPFIKQIDHLLLIADLIPRFTESISTGSDYRPFLEITLKLLEKLLHQDQLMDLLTLIVDSQFTEEIGSSIYKNNFHDPESLDKCKFIEKVCIFYEKSSLD